MQKKVRVQTLNYLVIYVDTDFISTGYKVVFDTDYPTKLKDGAFTGLHGPHAILVNNELHKDTARYVIEELRTRLKDGGFMIDTFNGDKLISMLRVNTLYDVLSVIKSICSEFPGWGAMSNK